MKTTMKIALMATGVSVSAWATCESSIDMGGNAIENLQDVNIATAPDNNASKDGVNAKSVESYIDTLLADGTITGAGRGGVGFAPRTCGGSVANYGTITYNGFVWLDRNLGSTQVAAFRDDLTAAGDLYQWGRRGDGHQCRDSATTSTLATDSADAGSEFITTSAAPNDWVATQNDGLWTTAGDGSNEVCPRGYHVPSSTEWDNDLGAANYNDAYNFIKLPVGGRRTSSNSTGYTNLHYYWSSTPHGANVWAKHFKSGGAQWLDYPRATGVSVRCKAN